MTSARKTRLKLAARKPRNPLVAPTLQRKAGRHGKSTGAQRRAEEVQLKKQLKDL